MDPADRHLSPADTLAAVGSSGGERERAERHAAACPACAALLSRQGQVFTWLAEGLDEVHPPAAVWARIAQAIAAPLRERLAARFAAQVAALTDLAEAQVRGLFAQWDEAGTWSEASPGVTIFHFEGGPAVAGAITGFVRIEAGGAFPEHRHLGREWNLVLEGALVLSGGRVARAGEVVEMEPGTSHAVAASGGEAAVYLAVALEGIAIDGTALDPEDSRA